MHNCPLNKNVPGVICAKTSIVYLHCPSRSYGSIGVVGHGASINSKTSKLGRGSIDSHACKLEREGSAAKQKLGRTKQACSSFYR